MVSARIGDRKLPDRLEQQLCGLSSTLPDQHRQRCEQRATLHLLVEHPEHGTDCMLLACSEHT